MTTNTQTRLSTFNLARAALYADAAVAAAIGLAVLAGAEPISAFMGLQQPRILTVLGAVFLPYAAGLAWHAASSNIPRRAIVVAMVLNELWVLGSVGLLLSGALPLTTGGKWLVGVVAEIALLIAIAQFVALRRIGK